MDIHSTVKYFEKVNQHKTNVEPGYKHCLCVLQDKIALHQTIHSIPTIGLEYHPQTVIVYNFLLMSIEQNAIYKKGKERKGKEKEKKRKEKKGAIKATH